METQAKQVTTLQHQDCDRRVGRKAVLVTKINEAENRESFIQLEF